MRIGLHVHVAGGYVKAVEHAKTAGCAALQVFSTNPRSYRTSADRRCGARRFCTPSPRSWARSMRDPYAVSHQPCERRSEDRGRLASAAEKRSRRCRARRDALRQHSSRFVRHARAICRHLARFAAALESALAGIAPGVFLVLENSAGAGNLAGGTLEELGAFIRSLAHPQLGICLDTAHAWASGYAIDSKEGVDRFVEAAQREIGLDRVLMFHFNDTQVALGGEPRSPLAYRRGPDRLRRLSGAACSSRVAREDGDSRNAGQRRRRPAKHADHPGDCARGASGAMRRAGAAGGSSTRERARNRLG